MDWIFSRETERTVAQLLQESLTSDGVGGIRDVTEKEGTAARSAVGCEL